MNQHSEGTGGERPFIVKSETEKQLEAEIEELENGLKGLSGEAWSEQAGAINKKEKELKEEHEKILGYFVPPPAPPKIVMSESTVLQEQKAFQAREQAFAQAKRRAEEMRASYAKPYSPATPASSFWSRLTSWWRGTMPAQEGTRTEARKKIVEALAPELTQQEAARQEAARRNAQAYEARALSKSRQAAEGEKEEVQAAK